LKWRNGVSDVFREVDEELRRDRLMALWKRFGPYLIGAAVALVLVVAGRAYLARVENPRCRIAGYAYIARFEPILDAIEGEHYILRPDYPERGNAMIHEVCYAFFVRVTTARRPVGRLE